MSTIPWCGSQGRRAQCVRLGALRSRSRRRRCHPGARGRRPRRRRENTAAVDPWPRSAGDGTPHGGAVGPRVGDGVGGRTGVGGADRSDAVAGTDVHRRHSGRAGTARRERGSSRRARIAPASFCNEHCCTTVSVASVRPTRSIARRSTSWSRPVTRRELLEPTPTSACCVPNEDASTKAPSTCARRSGPAMPSGMRISPRSPSRISATCSPSRATFQLRSRRWGTPSSGSPNSEMCSNWPSPAPTGRRFCSRRTSSTRPAGRRTPRSPRSKPGAT